MRKSLLSLGSVVLLGLLAAGCAGPEQKLGRGLNNTFEIVRGGEMRRSMEQTALWHSPDEGYTWGAVRGVRRTFTRTGLGLWEVLTFPIPNHGGGDYGPIATDYFKAQPVYPDNYTPALMDDSLFATDSRLGFSSGDIAPMIPGSRFNIYDF